MNAEFENEKTFWVRQLEILINRVLSLDEEVLDELRQMEGKVIAFEFVNTRLKVYLFPNSSGLLMQTSYDDHPDVLIRGTLGNFMKMMAASKQGKKVMPADIQLTGNVVLAQQFQKIMQNVDINLEEPLSKWVGDTLTHKIGKFVKDSVHFSRNAGKTLFMDLSEYLRFEIEMLPDDLLVEEFCKDVDVLREDMDCLSKRVDKLDSELSRYR